MGGGEETKTATIGTPARVAPAPAAAVSSNPWVGTAYDNGFIDLDKLLQAQQYYQSTGGQGGVDGQLLLSTLKPLTGVTTDSNDAAARARTSTLEAMMGGHMEGSGDTGQWIGYASAPTPVEYRDAGGRKFRQTGADANGNPLIQFYDNGGGGWENPTGNEHDRVQPIYSLNKDGTATPVDAGASHQAGWWTDYGRDLAKWAAVMGTAGTAGAYLGGAEAAGAGAGAAGGTAAAEGAGGLSGMDLAADAAIGTGNNVTTAGSVFGSGGTAATGAGETLANTGSDAHFYNNPTAAEGGLGNMGGAGTATIPSLDLSSGTSGISDWLKTSGETLLKNRNLIPLVSGLLGSMGGKSGGGSGVGGGAVARPAQPGSWTPVTQTGGGMSAQQPGGPGATGPMLQNSGLARFGATANPYTPRTYTPATYQASRFVPQGAAQPMPATPAAIAGGGK